MFEMRLKVAGRRRNSKETAENSRDDRQSGQDLGDGLVETGRYQGWWDGRMKAVC